MSPKPRVRMQVAEFGYVGLAGIRRESSKQHNVLLNVRLVEAKGMRTIQKAIDEITGVKLYSTHGEHTSMIVEVTVNTHGKREPERFARNVGCDLIGRIEANCKRSVPHSDYKHVRTPARRGATSAGRKR